MTPQEKLDTLFRYISIRCRRNGYTPSYYEMARSIKGCGARTATVSSLLNKLEAAGRISREGKTNARTFRLPGTNFVTRPVLAETVKTRSVFSTAGWPRPTKLSAVAYDAAVERMEFSLHEMPDLRIERPVYVPKPMRQVRSLTGCSAELAAV